MTCPTPDTIVNKGQLIQLAFIVLRHLERLTLRL
jgi:hypothetical protein